MEERSLKRSNEFNEFYEKNKSKPINIHKPKTKEEETEESLAGWFGVMKTIKKRGKGTRKLYPSVETILVDLLGENWYENEDLKENSLLKVNEFKTFYENNKRKPSDKKYTKTDEEKTEKLLSGWFRYIKNCKKGIGKEAIFDVVFISSNDTYKICFFFGS